MYIRKSVQNTINVLNSYQKVGKIREDMCKELVEKCKNFNFEHRGYSRYNFMLFFIIWEKENIWDVIKPYVCDSH